MTAIPEEGIVNATKLMKMGYLNRYQNEDNDYLIRTETALATFLGTKYCIGLNSGASAIFLLLKAAGVRDNMPVLSNAFTFNAVPSCILHAGGKPVLVECDKTFVVNIDHLLKILNGPNPPKIFLLSYMRGRVPNMDRIMEIVEKYNLILIEDIAHALGVRWKNRLLGTFGVSAATSTQSNKLMNAGEGGFAFTNCPHIQAKCILMSGCYERYYRRHKQLMPPEDIMQKHLNKYLNYSVRMTNLQASILLPQVYEIPMRKYITNQNYDYYTTYLQKAFMAKNINIEVPGQLDDVQPVNDSVQFFIKDMSIEQVNKAIAGLNKQKIKIAVFGHPLNARNFESWDFLNVDKQKLLAELPDTKKHLMFALDMRIPMYWPKQDMEQRADTIVNAFAAIKNMSKL